MKPTSNNLNTNCLPLTMDSKLNCSTNLNDSSIYLYPTSKSEKIENETNLISSRVITFRRFILIVTLLNFIAISFVTGYILYNVWLLEKSINQPFVDWEKQDSSLTKISFSKSHLTSTFQSPLESSKSNSQQCSLPDESKFDCNPDDPVNQERCESRGCCWVPATRSKRNIPPLNIPYCFYPTDYKTYKVADVQQGDNNATIKLTRLNDSGYPMDIDNIDIQVIGLDNERLRIRFLDADKDRFEVPMPFFNLSRSETIDSPLYKIKVNDDGKLTISRLSTGTEVFVADLSKMIYSDQFIQLSVQVPSKVLYGLGEHKASFRKELTGWHRYTMFARDIGPTENVNLYGSYPFYIMPENDDQMNSHGVFLLNSNGMDVLTQAAPAVTWRTIGGILDFFIFFGPTPADVTKQNINLIGKPVLQPYWSFGFHLCRYGYDSLAKTKETMERNLAAGIPIESQWNDIDYMDRYNDFTVDSVNFAGLAEFAKDLHAKNMYYSIILDPGVSASEPKGTYPPYDEGVVDDIFVKNSDGTIFVGKVWNLDTTVFPDFTHPNASNYWKNQLLHLREKVEFDGIWIDMNEPSNFFNGQKTGGCPQSSLENPPYAPGGTGLTTKTLCMTCKQHLGSHYDVHNLYGLYENVATHSAAVDIFGTRPFILSRSTFPSQGHFASHWSGDIQSSWDHMKYSISNMFEFNIYGIPMIGSDICGFAGSTQVELCMRWSALGAFYPFSRNHNDRNAMEQDPAILGEKVVAAAKYSLDARYKLLPYLYGLFFKAHSNAETVVRPLFFEFPLDSNTYSIETAFLWGSWLYIVPILEPSTNQVTAYFPAGSWYNFADSKLAFNSSGQSETLTIDDDKIGLFVRGGGIIPTYKSSAKTTHDLRKQKYYLNAYLDNSGNAVGEIYHDDGKSLDSVTSGNYIHGKCKANTSGLVCSYLNIAEIDDFAIGGVMIAGLSDQPKKVSLNGQYITTNKYNQDKSSISIDFNDNFYPRQSFAVNFEY